MQQSTSDIMRKLMRLVVTDGYGKTAEVPGYFVGGKTGTAEKVGAHGYNRKHANVSAFMSVFPMNAPRYAVYMMLDEPHANQGDPRLCHRRLGERAGGRAGDRADRADAGLLPETENAAAINAQLAQPLEPGRPRRRPAAQPPPAAPPAKPGAAGGRGAAPPLPAAAPAGAAGRATCGARRACRRAPCATRRMRHRAGADVAVR